MHCSAKEIIKNRNECFVSLDSRKAESGKILFLAEEECNFSLRHQRILHHFSCEKITFYSSVLQYHTAVKHTNSMS